MHLCRRNTSRIDINCACINTAYVNFVCKTEKVYVHLFKALNSLICASVPLRNYSLTHYVHLNLLSLLGMREHIVYCFFVVTLSVSHAFNEINEVRQQMSARHQKGRKFGTYW